ncbi:hypothetical protein ACET3Z_011548 [Daucus carota]
MTYDIVISALGKICRFHRNKLNSAQVVRKNWSKNLQISDCQKATPQFPLHRPARLLKKTRRSTPHLHRRADSIMNLLAHRGGISKIRIRQFLGDGPDTSKALRMLMKQAVVKRFGAGGRCDPYIYMIA